MAIVRKVFLDQNFEPTARIENGGVFIKYSDFLERYVLEYKYFRNSLIYIRQKDLMTGKTKIYSFLKIKFETIKSLLQFNSNRKYFASQNNIVRNLIENLMVI